MADHPGTQPAAHAWPVLPLPIRKFCRILVLQSSNMTLDKLKAETLKLNRLERMEFIRFVLETLMAEEADRAEAFHLSDEQKEAARERMADIKEGKVKTTSAEEVEAKLRKKYGFDD